MARKMIVAAVAALVVGSVGSALAGAVAWPGTTMTSARADEGAILATRQGFTQQTIVPQGGTVQLVVADPIWDHSVISIKHRKGRPLFSSGFVTFGQSGLVGGVERLAPGTYAFTCRIHEWWAGSIQVVSPDGAVDLP